VSTQETSTAPCARVSAVWRQSQMHLFMADI